MYQKYPFSRNREVRAQQEQTDRGGLQVTVLTEDGAKPVENALVRIS